MPHATNATYKIHSSIHGANLVKNVGEVIISAKWKETKNQKSMERAVILPMECLKAPEVPESFRALVEAALLTTAESLLKKHVNEEPNNWEVLASVFDRPNMVESFIAGGSTWMSKEELELSFTASATWKRITGRAEFTNNKTYQQAANYFKESILKLTGKATKITAEDCDKIISKIEDSDLETEFGAFVVKRLTSIKQNNSDVFDLDAL